MTTIAEYLAEQERLKDEIEALRKENAGLLMQIETVMSPREPSALDGWLVLWFSYDSDAWLSFTSMMTRQEAEAACKRQATVGTHTRMIQIKEIAHDA